MAKIKDLNGSKYGKLTVMSYNNTAKKWICQCECGNLREVARNKLTSGIVTECKLCGERTRTKLKIDLTGKTFGEWYIIGLSDNNKWKCECSCGIIKELSSYQLTSGRSKSCGHNSSKLKDILGQKFGKLTVTEYAGNAEWMCTCDCGNKVKVLGTQLRNGNTKSCGCDKGNKAIDLKGQKFGEWEVLNYLGNSYWECKCSCGNIEQVHSNSLRNGSSTCCSNPLHRIKHDIIGNKYGSLTVEKYLGNGIYKCKCDCGEYKDILAVNLINGSTKSCGCKTQELMKNTLLNKYGDTCPSRVNTPRTKDELSIVSSMQEFGSTIYKFIDTEKRLPTIGDMAVLANVSHGTIIKYINKYDFGMLIQDYNKSGHSKYEDEIMSLFPGAIQGDKKVLEGKELDLYFPNKRLAIEFNGTYWHNSELKPRDYHQEKTIDCAKKGIRLIHIFEYEWINEISKIKIINLLNSILNDNSKIIYAKNTNVKLIDKQEADIFLENYHLQGSANSSIRLGLYQNDELLGIMTFGIPRFNLNFEYEIIRLAWKNGVKVTGGIEKLFTFFIKQYNPESIISYCDIAKFTGNSYLKIGFTAKTEGITQPNYVWINTKDNSIIHRYKTQKHILLNKGLGKYGYTEDEIMKNLGYLKVYDAGNLRLEWYRH